MIKSVKKNVLSLIVAVLALAATVLISVFSLNFSSVYMILIGAAIGLTYYSIADKKQKQPAGADGGETKDAEQSALNDGMPLSGEEEGNER